MIQKISGFEKFNGLKAKNQVTVYTVYSAGRPGPGIKPGLIDPQARTLTTRPPHLLTKRKLCSFTVLRINPLSNGLFLHFG